MGFTDISILSVFLLKFIYILIFKLLLKINYILNLDDHEKKEYLKNLK